MMSGIALAFKSEVVLAALLVLRHRAPRLAGLLVLTMMGLVLLNGTGTDTSEDGSRTVLLVSGVLASVAGSRLLAPGAALTCAYRVAAPWWLVPSGRLVGASTVTLPLVAFGAVILIPHPTASTPFLLGAGFIGYYAATMSVTLAITPVVGASSAAVLGFLTAWFGIATPSTMQALLEKWPVFQGPAVLLWNTLPLHWRAASWIRDGCGIDILVLGVWTVAGMVGAAWTVAATHRSHRPPRGLAT